MRGYKQGENIGVVTSCAEIAPMKSKRGECLNCKAKDIEISALKERLNGEYEKYYAMWIISTILLGAMVNGLQLTYSLA